MITINNREELIALRAGGKILSRILKQLAAEVKPGVSTAMLENLANQLIAKAGGRPSFKNYEVANGRFFPNALCASINNEIVHGLSVPGRVLKKGDIIGLDLGMEYPVSETEARKFSARNRQSVLGGFYTDMAITMPVGKINKKIKKLLAVTRRALDIAIKEAKPNGTLNQLGMAVQNFVEREGFSVVRDLVGHGVGHQVHEDPEVFNYEFVSYGIRDTVLKPGMVIAIEPMVNIGKSDTKSGSDGFSIITADGSLSAHFEHTVAITEKGNIIITE
ncbi:MAG: type I methionyl aminopeptidase [Patescibacteria group bacterium]|nr:type I methionyl aminopeptidase [Patescibacteria group bacterium]